ncbi:MAG TPA: aminopeptidase [Opitutales bacterium]|nr:aminopeptidase [Opitutales bacterium]
MKNPHYERFAETLTAFSIKLQKGEKVLIDAFDIPEEMIISLVRKVRELGGIPFVNLNNARVTRELLRGGVEEQFALNSQVELQRMKAMDAYIGLRGSNNIYETSDVSSEQIQLAMREMKPVLDWRVGKTRWVVTRWPTPSMAQQAKRSTEEFEDFFFRVCTLDYSRMEPGMNALKGLMERTDRVEIKGPGTDLRFSIKDIPAIPCGGEHNIPDGEVFTCPVKESAEGEITFNTPTIYQGTSFEQIRLVLKEGKIVEATGSNTKRLNEILDSDPGARYIGEFALGFNPHIMEPMYDILFDEKIAGSFHFTPGQAYGIADNGNRSQVHWDMVSIQRPEYGGGEIYFDGELVRKDGIFVPEELKKLNPDYLLG